MRLQALLACLVFALSPAAGAFTVAFASPQPNAG
jgi:hypothetical protein